MPSYLQKVYFKSRSRKRRYSQYKARGGKVMSRAARAAARRRYIRRKRYNAIRRLQAKPLSFSRAITTPSCGDQTISKVVINESNFDVSLGPAQYAITKDGNLTNLIYYDPGAGTTQYNLQQCFEGLTVPVVQDFNTLCKLFDWVRFEWIRITLIPDSYEASGPDVGEPEYPILHVINDNGTAAIGLSSGSPTSTYTVDTAQTLPTHQYKQYYFNKPQRFYINMVERLPYDSGNVKGATQYSTAKAWLPTAVTGTFPSGTQYIPNDNFYFGFSQVPGNFSYKVKLEAKVKFKQINIAGNTT